MRARRIGAGVVFFIFGCGVSGGPAPTHDPPQPPDHPVVYPDPEWPTADPSDYGLSEEGLEEAAAYSESIGGLCLVVIRDGRLVFERYYNESDADTMHPVWSIAKSYTATLTGIALRRGELSSVDMPVAELVPELQGTDKETITVKDVLSQETGLHYNLVTDNTWSILTQDQTAEALSYGVDAPPGTQWHYNNHGVQLMHPLLKAATGMDPEQYAIDQLWGPLDMKLAGPLEERTHWNRDGAGNPTMYMNVSASCRDLARLGYLYLNHGQWKDQQILDPEFVDAALTPQALNPVYGWLWWLNGEGPGISSTDEPLTPTLFENAPDDLFGAHGLGQNFIDVVPSTRTVYVHTRPAPHDPLTNFITDPVGTIDAMLADGESEQHAILLQYLLDAEQEASGD